MRIYMESSDWLPLVGLLFDVSEGHSTNLGVSAYEIFANRDHNPTWWVSRQANLERDIINLWIGLEQG